MLRWKLQDVCWLPGNQRTINQKHTALRSLAFKTVYAHTHRAYTLRRTRTCFCYKILIGQQQLCLLNKLCSIYFLQFGHNLGSFFVFILLLVELLLTLFCLFQHIWITCTCCFQHVEGRRFSHFSSSLQNNYENQKAFCTSSRLVEICLTMNLTQVL